MNNVHVMKGRGYIMTIVHKTVSKVPMNNHVTSIQLPFDQQEMNREINTGKKNRRRGNS